MKIGSLCSGYGGLDLAAESVFGAETAWHCEIDAAASRVLEQRWPNTPNLYDLTAVDWDTVDPVDIITAGYPCQPFSSAGQRKGADDERHIWPFVREAIRRVRPRYTVLENVAGHRSLGFDRVLGDLAEDGLHVWWTSIRAADVGAPHGRGRVFLLVTDPTRNQGRLGHGDGRNELHDGTWGAQACGGGERVAARSAGSSPGPEPLDHLLPTPKAADGEWGLPRTSGRPIEKSTHLATIVSLLPTPRATDGEKGGPNQRGSSGDLMLPSAVCQLLPTPKASDASGGKHNSDGHADSLPGSVRLLPTPKAAERGDCKSEHERNDPDLRAITYYTQRWGKYETAIHRWERATRLAPAPTEPNTKGNPRLSAAFAEWMMGLPAGWVTDVDIPRTAQLKCLGNGVVPQQAIAALTWLLSMEAAA